jgi:hypothetical protein
MNDLRHHTTADLADYAEGALAPERLSAVERHLAGCGPCRAEVASWRGLFAGFEALPRPSAPRTLSARILTAIAAAPAPAPRHARVLPAIRRQLVHALTWSYAVGVAFTAALVFGFAFVPAVRERAGVGIASAASLALRAGIGLVDGLTAIGVWTNEASKVLFTRFEWMETLIRALETAATSMQASSLGFALAAISVAALAAVFVRFLHSGSHRDEVRHVGPLLA